MFIVIHLKKLGIFSGLYLVFTLLIVPNIAPIFGREKITETEFLKAHSIFYKLANRNYVRPILNESMSQIATEFEKRNSGIKMTYLDANFPFQVSTVSGGEYQIADALEMLNFFNMGFGVTKAHYDSGRALRKQACANQS